MFKFIYVQTRKIAFRLRGEFLRNNVFFKNRVNFHLSIVIVELGMASREVNFHLLALFKIHVLPARFYDTCLHFLKKLKSPNFENEFSRKNFEKFYFSTAEK